MNIPILIPVGNKYVAAVQGAVWKFVSCAKCHERYAYLLELQATGEAENLLFMDGDGAARLAQAKAEENLRQKSRNCILMVPCPSCGFYQEEMAKQLRDEASINPFQIAGAALAALSLVPLLFNIAYIWVLTVVLAVAGLAVLAYGYRVALRYDPNAGDPEPRKALGQKHAVWGQQLDLLLAVTADAPWGRPPEGGPPNHHIKPA
jgi:hypothetical protein